MTVPDEFFESTNLLTRENLATVLAECLKDTLPGDDSYRTDLWNSDDTVHYFEGKNIIDDNDFYNTLKEMNFTLTELITDIEDDTIIPDTLNEYIDNIICFYVAIDSSYEGTQYREERKQELTSILQSSP